VSLLSLNNWGAGDEEAPPTSAADQEVIAKHDLAHYFMASIYDPDVLRTICRGETLNAIKLRYGPQLRPDYDPAAFNLIFNRLGSLPMRGLREALRPAPKRTCNFVEYFKSTPAYAPYHAMANQARDGGDVRFCLVVCLEPNWSKPFAPTLRALARRVPSYFLENRTLPGE
jgi:hypothetical protein